MVKTVEVVAREPLTYQGRCCVPGECFEAEPKDAVLLLYKKKISAPRPIKRSPHYLRRDMRSER